MEQYCTRYKFFAGNKETGRFEKNNSKRFVVIHVFEPDNVVKDSILPTNSVRSTNVRDCKLKVESQRIFDEHGKYHYSPAAKCCCVSGRFSVPEKVLDNFRSRLRETKSSERFQGTFPGRLKVPDKVAGRFWMGSQKRGAERIHPPTYCSRS